MKPKEVLAFAKENGAQDGRHAIHRLPGAVAALRRSRSVSWMRAISRTGTASTRPASAAGSRSTRATCSSSPTRPRRKMDPFYAKPTLGADLRHRRPAHARDLLPRSPQHRPQGRSLSQEHRYRGHGATWVPRRSSSSSTTFASSPALTVLFIKSTPSKAPGTPAGTRAPTSGYKPRTKEAYFPCPPMDKFQDLRAEMTLVLEGLGIEIEAQHHEVATGQSEIDMHFKPLAPDGRPVDVVQIRS